MRRPSVFEVVFVAALVLIAWKVVKYPNHKLGCDGWHEWKQVD